MNDRNSVNKVILVGNLGNKPEQRDFNGRTVANFSVATNEGWTDSNGQRQERTQWHRVAAWGKLGEICARHLDKGRKVYIEGRLSYRNTERDGQTIRYTDIIASTVHFLDSRGSSNDYSNDYGRSSNNDSGYASNNPPYQNQSRSNYNSGGGSGSSSNYNSPMPSPPDDEDIPF